MFFRKTVNSLIAAGVFLFSVQAAGSDNERKENALPPVISAILSEAGEIDSSNPGIPAGRASGLKNALFDRAMKEALTIRDERDRKYAVMRILVEKSRMNLDFSSGRDVLERAMALAIELGDKGTEGICLLGLASYDGQTDTARALKLFREAGRNDYLAEGLQVLAGEKIVAGAGGELVPIVAEMKRLAAEEKSLENMTVGTSIGAYASEISKLSAEYELKIYTCGAEVLAHDAKNKLRYLAQPGIAGTLGLDEAEQRRFDYCLLWELNNTGSLLHSDIACGEKRELRTFSFGRESLLTRVTIVSENEKVTVPAGTFTGCRLVRCETLDSTESAAERASDSRVDSLDGIVTGIREIWYKPGTGIVRFRRIQGNADSSLVLVRCAVAPDNAGEYLPLAVGNTWIYTVACNAGAGYDVQYTLLVTDEKNGTYYLSHHGYVVKRK